MGTQFPTPHSRHLHIFVVLRLPDADRREREGCLEEHDITLMKAFRTESAAREEVNRLNELNKGSWSYSIAISRLVEDP